MQKHSFPCPNCGVGITYILDLDQEKASFRFRDPENGKWADDEDGAVKTLTFSDEIVAPASMPDFINPHIATWGRYDWEKCREDEGLRQLFVRKTFQYAERCRVHFERGNWDLFDKKSPSHDEGPVTAKSRLIDLYNTYMAEFSKFSLISRGKYDRIHQRLTYAKTLDQPPWLCADQERLRVFLAGRLQWRLRWLVPKLRFPFGLESQRQRLCPQD